MGPLKIITAILIWSSLGIMVRQVNLPNESIIFYTSLIACMVQFVLLSATGFSKKAGIREAGRRNALLLVLSPFCFIANTMFLYFAFRNTTIANAILTHYTAPIFVAVLAPLLLREKIKGATWFAIGLSSTGLWLILAGKGTVSVGQSTGNENLGIIAGAMSGLAYAFLIIIARKIASVYSSLFIIFVQNCIVVLALLPFVIGAGVPADAVPYLVVFGVFHSTIAPVLYVQGFRSVKANEAAILGYLEPVGAILLAFVVLHEVPRIQALFGGVLILYSGHLILKRRALC